MTRNAPPSHFVALCRKVAVWRLPIISMPVPAPPKPAARPPPFPAWRRMTTMSARQSRTSRMSRVAYMGGKNLARVEDPSRNGERFCPCGDDLRKAHGIEAGAADQGAVDVGPGQ